MPAGERVRLGHRAGRDWQARHQERRGSGVGIARGGDIYLAGAEQVVRPGSGAGVRWQHLSSRDLVTLLWAWEEALGRVARAARILSFCLFFLTSPETESGLKEALGGCV
jgi:hypothetical protein